MNSKLASIALICNGTDGDGQVLHMPMHLHERTYCLPPQGPPCLPALQPADDCWTASPVESPWDLNLTAKMLIESMEHMCTNQGCNKTLSHQDLTKHKEELCKFRMVRCPGRDPECKVELPICTFNNHIQNCKTTTPAKFGSILQRSLLMVIAWIGNLKWFTSTKKRIWFG